MRNLWKSVLVGLWVIGMGLGVSAPAQAASAVGPYYATPSWDQTLPASTRFIDLTNMPGAVLDRETGLVWEKVPSTAGFSWLQASIHCVQLSLGGRKGWRLPTIQDLASLIDQTQSNPALPVRPPVYRAVVRLLVGDYWASNSTGAWGVGINNGNVGGVDKSVVFHAWCVRGGPGVDPQ